MLSYLDDYEPLKIEMFLAFIFEALLHTYIFKQNFRMIEEMLEPVQLEKIQEPNRTWNEQQLGSHMVFNQTSEWEEEGIQLAIIGVPEDRSSIDNIGCATGTNHIRKELYQLYLHGDMPKTIDLGDIRQGNAIKDTQVALTTVLNELLDKRITAIIIGGGHDLTYAQYKSYENRIHSIDVTIIDEKIDIEEQAEIDSGSFLWHILKHEPNFLFSCTHLGHQLFYNNPKSLDMLESLNFDCFRLGEMKKDIFEMEPLMRNADMVSMDISVLRSADAPANAVTSPNGLSGEEACQLARFAGFSNKTSSFGIYEFNPYFDQNKQAAKQVSQMIWYFIEGFANRKMKDYPSENNKEFTKYIVKLESADYELIFWKSSYSNKWWMEIPQRDMKHGKFIPCSYSDYQNAMKDELPDRWMKVYAQLN